MGDMVNLKGQYATDWVCELVRPCYFICTVMGDANVRKSCRDMICPRCQHMLPIMSTEWCRQYADDLSQKFTEGQQGKVTGIHSGPTGASCYTLAFGQLKQVSRDAFDVWIHCPSEAVDVVW